MLDRVRFVVGSAAVALLSFAAPAHAEECVEVLQFKHCTEQDCVELLQFKHCMEQ